MGRFYNTKIWLEDREIEILESYDFTEETLESEIAPDKRWILDDLVSKGFLQYTPFEGSGYYLHAGGYLQHFEK